RQIPVGGLRSLGASAALVTLDPLVDLLAVDGHVLGRGDPDAHLVSLDAKHRDRDGVADHQCLSDASSQNQHKNLHGLAADPPAAAAGAVQPAALPDSKYERRR